jgi:hypothetical protein
MNILSYALMCPLGGLSALGGFGRAFGKHHLRVVVFPGPPRLTRDYCDNHSSFGLAVASVVRAGLGGDGGSSSGSLIFE